MAIGEDRAELGAPQELWDPLPEGGQGTLPSSPHRQNPGEKQTRVMDPPKIQILRLQAIKSGIGFLINRRMNFWRSVPSRQRQRSPGRSCVGWGQARAAPPAATGGNCVHFPVQGSREMQFEPVNNQSSRELFQSAYERAKPLLGVGCAASHERRAPGGESPGYAPHEATLSSSGKAAANLPSGWVWYCRSTTFYRHENRAGSTRKKTRNVSC